jgi:hypothetical protein
MNMVNFNRPVSHITQRDENYCWACAFAMLLGRQSWEAAVEIADRCPQSSRNIATGAIIDPASAARAVHLRPHSVSSFSVADLARHLNRGAVAVFGSFKTERTFDHVMVVSQLRGDLDDPATIQLGVHDPYAHPPMWTGPWTSWYGPRLICKRVDLLVSR